MRAEPIILFAEDDENDVFLFEMAFRKAGTGCVLKHVPDGEAAIDYLINIGTYSDRVENPFPACVVTDLKMPKVDGFDLLAWIQKELPTGALPAVVLSGSEDERDKTRAAKLGAKAYWVKPTDGKGLASLAGQLTEIALHSGI
jgi:CheY-like chemotaxis protein